MNTPAHSFMLWQQFAVKPRARVRQQRGVVLLFSLITLVVLLIAAVALVRSFSNSTFTAGNIAFKRDLQNQSDRVVPGILTMFTSAAGALSTPAARAGSINGENYSATMLPSNSVGIPNILLASDATFAATWTHVDVLVRTLADVDQHVSIRYIIDRLCDNLGQESVLGPGRCVQTDIGAPQSKDANAAYIPPPQQVVYRITVRVTGPRNTQTFFQTTFSV